MLNIFNPAVDLHAGLEITGGEFHYILLAKKQGKAPEVLLRKKGNVSSMKIPFGFPVHTALHGIPSLLVHDEFAPHTPEEWIDQNEARIIPRGVSSNEIINEWCVENETIYSGTITKKSFQKAMALFPENKFIYASLCLPMWDLAVLYGAYFPEPFVIWKLWSEGSAIGYVEKGKLCGLADFWAGFDDVAAKSDEILEEFQLVAKSLTHNNETVGIAVCGPQKGPAVSDLIKKSGNALTGLPAIKSVPSEFHEAYALALHEDTSLDFAQVDQTQSAGKLVESRRKTLTLLRWVAVFLAIFLGALFALNGAAMIADRYVTKKMAPVQKYFGQYKAEQTRLEGLMALLHKKTQFVSQKSMMTFPLVEFQTAFPEGVWAEEISFSEGSSDAWNCTIIAFSNTSGDIPVLINNISSIRGMTAVRMVYSEQTGLRGKNGDRAIKFRVEAAWKG